MWRWMDASGRSLEPCKRVLCTEDPNHRQDRGPSLRTRPGPRPRRVPGYAESLLPAAALYGANASGKSNVLAALAFMRDTVIFSHRAWSPDEGVPRDPFAWGPKRDEPSLFEVAFLHDDVR